MRRSLLGGGAVCAGALALVAPAAAHVTITPAGVAAYHTEKFTLTSPNERGAPMTGFTLTVPKGFDIVEAGHQTTWHPVVSGSKVTWSGGSLPPNTTAAFDVKLKAPATPGAVRFEAKQDYRDGAVVRWPVAFTVTPGTHPSQHLGRAALAAAVGLVATVLFVLVAWRRRGRLVDEA